MQILVFSTRLTSAENWPNLSLEADIMESILLILLGFMLGLFGPLLLQWNAVIKKKKDFKKGLYTELQQTFAQLVGTFFLLEDTLGELDQSIGSSAVSMLSKYPEGNEELLEQIKSYLNETDGKLKARGLIRKLSKPKTLSVKKIMLPFMQQNISAISLLGPKPQRLITTVQRYISHLNEETDLYYFYFKKTFDSALSSNNRRLLEGNINKSYRVIAGLSYEIAEITSRILPHLAE